MYRSPHPISTTCPKCGSSGHRRVDPDWQPAIVNDRLCRQCGTRYSPPPPVYIAPFVYVLGTFSTVAGIWFLFRFFLHDDAAWVNPGWSALMVLVGPMAITIWVRRPPRG